MPGNRNRRARMLRHVNDTQHNEMEITEDEKQVQSRLCDGVTTTASLHISAFGYLKSSPTCPSHCSAQ